MSTPAQFQFTPRAYFIMSAFVVVWFVRRLTRKRVVLLDWDLTLDCLSTPGSKQVTRETRNEIMNKIGMTRVQEQSYMFTLRGFLNTLVEHIFEDNVVYTIVTRNDADNVRWMLRNVCDMDPGTFKIISDKHKMFDNKIELVVSRLGISAAGVWVLVDDSSSEHKNAAEYAKENCPKITLRHVYVKRPGKGDAYNYQYGIMNQREALQHLSWATNVWNMFW